jgi:hypothetical protein
VDRGSGWAGSTHNGNIGEVEVVASERRQDLEIEKFLLQFVDASLYSGFVILGVSRLTVPEPGNDEEPLSGQSTKKHRGDEKQNNQSSAS